MFLQFLEALTKLIYLLLDLMVQYEQHSGIPLMNGMPGFKSTRTQERGKQQRVH